MFAAKMQSNLAEKGRRKRGGGGQGGERSRRQISSQPAGNVDCWLCGMPLWLREGFQIKWVGTMWAHMRQLREESGRCVCAVQRYREGGLSADCHVEARRTPELIYYFNSRSKCLPFVCSCFTISAECRVINDASLWGLPPPLPQLLPLYHIMRKHGVVNRFSNAASIGICVYFGQEGEGAWGRRVGPLIFIRLLWHHLTQFPFCWTNLVSEHKFMCMQDEG